MCFSFKFYIYTFNISNHKHQSLQVTHWNLTEVIKETRRAHDHDAHITGDEQFLLMTPGQRSCSLYILVFLKKKEEI